MHSGMVSSRRTSFWERIRTLTIARLARPSRPSLQAPYLDLVLHHHRDHQVAALGIIPDIGGRGHAVDRGGIAAGAETIHRLALPAGNQQAAVGEPLDAIELALGWLGQIGAGAGLGVDAVD